uniref:Uncharacterized protein n=1 Tax=Monopterus albus TaxID=43700 RepID=A0A3Q3K798_MONAL
MIAAQDLQTEFQFPQEAESQLSSDTDFEDPDGKNARTGRSTVCFSKLISLFIYFLCLPIISTCTA